MFGYGFLGNAPCGSIPSCIVFLGTSQSILDPFGFLGNISDESIPSLYDSLKNVPARSILYLSEFLGNASGGNILSLYGFLGTVPVGSIADLLVIMGTSSIHPYYPHHLNGIEFFSRVNKGLDSLLSP